MANRIDEDWETILAFLPEQWEKMAFETKAMRRARAFKTPEALLRTLMIHLGQGCSLRETSVRAKRGDIASVSDVAILKRLRASEMWLKYLAENLTIHPPLDVFDRLKSKYRICAVDATTVSEPGNTGTEWRLHYMLELPTLACEHFELTDCHGGESLKRYPVRKNDLILADRGYESARGIEYVRNGSGHVAVRIRVSQCSLCDPDDAQIDVLSLARSLNHAYACGEWPAVFNGQTAKKNIGRLCLLQKSDEAIEASQKKIMRTAMRKQRKTSPNVLEAAKYIGIFTTVSKDDLSVEDVFRLYRYRWQIEIAFKRLKSLSGFGHLPKYDAQSCRAWIYGKLLIGLLAEKMAQAPFFP